MASFTQIRQGLADNLSTVRFSNGGKPQVSGYMLSQPSPPALQVFPGPLTYDYTMHRGLDQSQWVVQAVVAFNDSVGSQLLLDELCAASGVGSVKAALETDKTLGGTVADLHVTDMSGYRVVDTGAGTLVVNEWNVTVLG